MYYKLFTPHIHEAGKYLNEWAFKRLMQGEVRKTRLAERQLRQSGLIAPHTKMDCVKLGGRSQIFRPAKSRADLRLVGGVEVSKPQSLLPTKETTKKKTAA